MLSVVEYETEFALIGVPQLQEQRFNKSDGWTRPIIARVIDIGEIIGEVDLEVRLLREEVRELECEIEGVSSDSSDFEQQVADLEKKVIELTSELATLKESK